MELEDIDKITRKVQNGFESFTFLTKDGVSKTLGFNSDRVLLQTDPVLDRKAEEKEAKRQAEADAKQEEEFAKERVRINEEYAKSVEESIQKISEARAEYNKISADF
jgi:hypothetical protein